MITTRSLLCYGSIPSKANLCVFGNTKLDQGEDRLTQTLVFPKFSYIYRNTWCLNLLRNIIMESAVTAHAKKGKD